MLVAKRVVEALTVDPHVFHQVLYGSSLVTARPENLHGFLEDFIPIELFLSRHFCCPDNSLYAFWNEQSRKQGGVREELKKKGAPKSTPSGSAGASLDSLTKKTALTFAEDWYKTILKHQVKGTASTTIFEKEGQEYELIDPADGQRIDIGTKEAMTDLKAEFGPAGKTYIIRRGLTAGCNR
jgi:hypothetical protein